MQSPDTAPGYRVSAAFPTSADQSLTPALLQRYGPLMTLQQIAELLDRSPAGIRVGLYADNETSALLTPAKIKIGRRLYFRTATIGSAIDALGALP